jgi:hypothetical protein
MPELVRNLVGRLRAALADRRRAPRKLLRLPCTVTINDPHASAAPQRPAPTLSGFTHDASASGVALVLPSVRVGGRYLTDAELRLRLELPDGALELLARPVRYEQLPPDAAEAGYLIGARVAHIDAASRARFESLLRG